MPDPKVAAMPARRGESWTPDQIAFALVPRRDRLVAQLPREIAAARDLSRDQCELVIDESLDYVVTQHARPITERTTLERVFWSAASIRVKRIHEGRSATVRGGWRRVDVHALQLAAQDAEPEARAVARIERALVLEFAAGLTARERLVVACKYGGARGELGRRCISRILRMPISEVRKHERAIARKLGRFALSVSAGTLCHHRDAALAGLALGTASREQELIARIHILHCAACRAGFTLRLRRAHADSSRAA